MELKDGDVVKLEVGAHIDGFPAMVGHTVVVGATAQTPVTGRKADLIQAAYLASEGMLITQSLNSKRHNRYLVAALRLLRPGKNNFDVTDTVQKVAQEFGVLPMEGMLSTELRRTVLDGQKQIILNPTEEQRRQFQVSEFASGEVYSIDVLMTTSEDAKGRPSQKYRTTIYKRLPDAQYSLKMQTSRKVYSEITQKADCMPFNLRAADDEKKARMGVVECAKHGLLLPYDIIEEKEGEFVAQFLFTALLMPSGSILKITNPPFDQSLVKSDKSLQSVELKQLVTGSLKAPKKK
jgi:curved DNA binding protein